MSKSIDISKYVNSRTENSNGAEPKFWISFNNNSYLFKYKGGYENLSIGEVFVSFLCSKVGVNCVNADFASCFIGDVKKDGCVIKSYITSDVRESFSLSELVASATNEKSKFNINFSPDLVMTYLNTLQERKGYSIDPNIFEQLKEIALIDYITSQSDRHPRNIEFLVYPTENEKGVVKLAPMFDNGRCFSLYLLNEDILKEGDSISHSRQFFCMKEKYTESEVFRKGNMVGIALEIQQNERIKAIFDKLSAIKIADFIDEFEQAKGFLLDSTIKDTIIGTWEHRFELIKEALVMVKSGVGSSDDITTEKEKRQSYVSNHGIIFTDYYLNFYYLKYIVGEDVKLDEYVKLNKEYLQSVDNWINLGGEMPKIPALIAKALPEDTRQSVKSKIELERYQRLIKAHEYEDNYLTPNIFILNYYQSMSEIKAKNLSEDERRSAIKNARKELSSFEEAVEAWVDMGDDLHPMPTIEGTGIKTDIKYDKKVLEKYIDEVEHKHINCNSDYLYRIWLKEVGMEKFADKIHDEVQDNFMRFFDLNN